jgi:hypothetical protein
LPHNMTQNILVSFGGILHPSKPKAVTDVLCSVNRFLSRQIAALMRRRGLEDT